MAGAKGRSGGPRKNAGGARPGSGRKPKEKVPPPLHEGDDNLKLLEDIAFGRVDATNIQVRAAITAVQYTHTKKGDGGKKEEQAGKAKKVAGGKFSASAPPKLAATNGKRV